MKKKLLSIALALTMVLMITLPVLAATWLTYYPTIVIDSSGGDRTAVPVITGINGQGLIDSGVLSSSGMDSRMRLSGTDIPYMISHTQITTYLDSLPALGQSQVDLYTGYSDLNPDMDIITGTDGYITIDDDNTLELGSDFEVEQKGYVDTGVGVNKNLVYKEDAYKTFISGEDEISGVIYFDEPEELIPSGFNAWTEVDVSDYVPNYATGLVLHLATEGAAKDVGVRINGSVDALKNDLYYHGWTIVGIDTDDIFDLFLEDATAHCYLVGFTGEDFTYITNADDISLVAALAWTDIDISTEAPSATGAIIVVLNTDAVNAREWGIQKKGSADNRFFDTQKDGISWGIIGVDGSQVFEGYVETLDVDFYLVGYTIGNVTFNTNGIDKSLAAGFGAWTPIDCSGDTTPATTHIIFQVDAANQAYGLRRNGSAEVINQIGWRHFWAIVECDEDQVVQGWATNNTVDWWIIGYVEEEYIDNPYEKEVVATGITRGEYTVKTYGVANEPAWATGDVLEFDGDSGDVEVTDDAAIQNIWDSGGTIECLIYAHSDGEVNAGSIANKAVAAGWVLRTVQEAAGKIKIELFVSFAGENGKWVTTATEVTLNTWAHVAVTYDSDNVANDPTIYIDGSPVAITETTTPTLVRDSDIGDDLYIGNSSADNLTFDGIIGGVRLYSSILGAATITDYFEGNYSDRTNLIGEWYMDEGTGVDILDYSGNSNTGTITGATWETSTFTTGSTGRLCDFYIEVDDGVTDPDRWGKNLKGSSVALNGNDWKLNQNNVMPWMDYYYHTVGGVQHAWYQPNDIVDGTDYDGTADAGCDADTIIDAELVQADDYWVGALVTITGAGAAAPEGEARVCTAFADATNEITVSPVFSAAVELDDTYTVDFGTLIDRSYYGLDFDGVNDVVIVTHDASLDITNEITLEVWALPRAVGSRRIIHKGLRAVNEIYAVLWRPERYLWFRLTDDAVVQHNLFPVDKTFPLDTMLYIVMTYDGNRMRIYANGDLSTLGGVDIFTIGTSARDLYFGTNENVDEYFDGLMDGIRIYNRALELAEIQYNYNGGAGRYTPYSTSGLVAEWHIEEGTGAAIADTSGEGNNGVITGATWANGYVPRPAGNSGTNDSRLTWGVNDEITLVYGEPVNYATTASGLYGEGGYTVAEADMPAEWYGTAGGIANLPLYDMYAGISANIGMPVQTLYMFTITGLCFAFCIAGFMMFNSVVAAIVGIGLGLGIGSAMTVVPLWIFFVFLVLAIGITYLKGRTGI